MRLFQLVVSVISKYLPIWILLCAFIAFIIPEFFSPIRNATNPALGVIFLLMGMSLSIDSFVKVIKKPKDALIGVIIKWVVSVGVSVLLAYIFFSNHPDLAAGVILAGSVSSGTSANLYSLIAGGEVALSITMATIDTFISPIVTPAIMQGFAGKFISIDFWSLFLDIIYVVLIPLVLGLFLKWKSSEMVSVITPYTSVLSMLALFIVVLSVVSSAQASLASNLPLLPVIFFTVFLQVIIPMFAGYFISKRLKIAEKNCRAILFHTGICNTALAATLAMHHLNSMAAVPAVANMIVNLTVGAIVSNYFHSRIQPEQTGIEKIRTS